MAGCWECPTQESRRLWLRPRVKATCANTHEHGHDTKGSEGRESRRSEEEEEEEEMQDYLGWQVCSRCLLLTVKTRSGLRCFRDTGLTTERTSALPRLIGAVADPEQPSVTLFSPVPRFHPPPFKLTPALLLTRPLHVSFHSLPPSCYQAIPLLYIFKIFRRRPLPPQRECKTVRLVDHLAPHPHVEDILTSKVWSL